MKVQTLQYGIILGTLLVTTCLSHDYLQHLEKGAPCVAATPSHPPLFPLPGTPFLPNQHLFILLQPAEISPPPRSLPGLPQQSWAHPQALWLAWVSALDFQQLLSVSPPCYKPLTGRYHIPLKFVLLELGIKVQRCIFIRHNPVQYTLLLLFLLLNIRWKKGKGWSLSLRAWINSIHTHNLSRRANVWRTQACTLLKSIYDTGSKSQALVISRIRRMLQGVKQLPHHAFEVVFWREPLSMC